MSILQFKQLKPNTKNVKIMGRCTLHNDILFLSFSASGVEFDFAGVRLYADIKTDKWDDEGNRGYAGVFINGVFSHKIELDEEQKLYEVYVSKCAISKPVKVRIVRYSETNFGKMGIVAFYHDGMITPTGTRDRRIEFIGDSITCGYGVEAENELCQFSTATENPMEGYAIKTAEALKADWSLVSWSGNGIITHWIPGDVQQKDELYPLMTPVYELQDVAGAQFMGTDPEQKYEFSSFRPDTVVINLGTNDDSYVRNHADRLKEFEDAFEVFLKMVISHRPASRIVVAYGVMSTNVLEAEERCVQRLKDDGFNIDFLRLPTQTDEDEKGADYHPGKKTHDRMAELLVDFIK